MPCTLRSRVYACRAMRGRVLIVVFGVALLAPAAARGAAVTPTRFDDTNGTGCPSDCSLRQAIAAAGAGGTVSLRTPPGGAVDTYALTQGTLSLGSSITI